MISAEQEELNRLTEQLEAVTRTAEENKADAVQWMAKYKQAAAEAEAAKLAADHAADTVTRIQRASLVNENRVELLLNILSDYSTRLRRYDD